MSVCFSMFSNFKRFIKFFRDIISLWNLQIRINYYYYYTKSTSKWYNEKISNDILRKIVTPIYFI